MRSPWLVAPLLLLLLPLHSAEGGKRGKRDRPKAPAEEPVSIELPAWSGTLFEDRLPLDPGLLPAGLANASAQGCTACHAEVVGGWRAGAHAGPPPTSLLQAAEAAETPACLTCHLPLAVQHPSALVWSDAGLVTLDTPQPAWDPVLEDEGVTCIACHLRDNTLIGPIASRPAPHAVATSEALSSSTTCATCHQLTWPGAEAPLYDTWGEWSRSGWATAGVDCVDCHMGAGAGRTSHGADHAVRADLQRAVSVLLDLDEAVLVRGTDGISGELTLQNTGAGHSVPTGSPYRGYQLEVRLRQGDHATTVLEAKLGRELSTEAPWLVVVDDRLPAGGSRSWPLKLTLPQDVGAADWRIEVVLLPTLRGAVDGPAELEYSLGLRVR